MGLVPYKRERSRLTVEEIILFVPVMDSTLGVLLHDQCSPSPRCRCALMSSQAFGSHFTRITCICQADFGDEKWRKKMKFNEYYYLRHSRGPVISLCGACRLAY